MNVQFSKLDHLLQNNTYKDCPLPNQAIPGLADMVARFEMPSNCVTVDLLEIESTLPSRNAP